LEDYKFSGANVKLPGDIHILKFKRPDFSRAISWMNIQDVVPKTPLEFNMKYPKKRGWFGRCSSFQTWLFLDIYTPAKLT